MIEVTDQGSSRRWLRRGAIMLVAAMTGYAAPCSAAWSANEYVVPTGPTFLLPDGARIEGHIIALEPSQIVILKPDGTKAALARDNDQRVQFTTVAGRTLIGRLRSWQPGIYEIDSSNRPVKVFSSAPRVILADALRRTDEPKSQALQAQLRPAMARGTEPAEPSVVASLDEPEELPEPEPLQIRVLQAVAAESERPLAFDIDLSAPAPESFVLIYATIDGSAKGGVDFEPQRGVLIVDKGARSARIETPLIDDQDVEGDEDLQLFLSIDPAVGSVTTPILAIIEDDD